MESVEPKSLSVIVPVFNEQDSIAHLHAEIVAACRALGRPFEVILIDDGSSDNTPAVLATLSPAKIITLRRNFGQTAAMDSGIKAATGYYVVPMDGDGQNDPVDIGKLIAKLEAEDLDVVSGWRKHRMDKSGKRWASRVAAFVRKHLINDGIHDSGCSLKVYKRECFAKVNLYGEMHRFIPALLKIKGYKVGEEVVNHRGRTAGTSKYTWKRGVKGILDMFAVAFWHKYAARPLHLFGGLGVLFMGVSAVSGAYAILMKIFIGQDLSSTSLTILSLFGFFIGVVLFCFGLIADMQTKIYFGISNDTPYDVKSETEQV